jgi:hypothetical protein
MLLFRIRPLPGKAAKTTDYNLFAPLRSHTRPGFSKNLLCPSHSTTSHVLAPFTRSLPADRFNKKLVEIVIIALCRILIAIAFNPYSNPGRYDYLSGMAVL